MILQWVLTWNSLYTLKLSKEAYERSIARKCRFGFFIIGPVIGEVIILIRTAHQGSIYHIRISLRVIIPCLKTLHTFNHRMEYVYRGNGSTSMVNMSWIIWSITN